MASAGVGEISDVLRMPGRFSGAGASREKRRARYARRVCGTLPAIRRAHSSGFELEIRFGPRRGTDGHGSNPVKTPTSSDDWQLSTRAIPITAGTSRSSFAGK